MVRWLCFWRPPCLLRAVIINFTADPATAIRGVLWSTRGPWLTFRECSLLKGGPVMPVDGEIVVHRDRISFLQVLP